MIFYLGMRLSWPFKYDPTYQKDYLLKSWRVTKNKTLEIQFSRMGTEIIGGALRVSTKEDHAGLVIDISLFRRSLIITFCDNRHWNYEADRYVDYNNPEEVEKYW